MANPASDPALIRALLIQGPRSLGGLQAELLMYSGQYLLHYRTPQGEHYKLLTPTAVRVALSGMRQDSGWLPPGLLRCGENTHGPFAVLWQPPTRHTIALLLGDDPQPTLLTVPLPGLVLAGLATSYWVWALAGPTWTPDAPLYHAPVPNVYDDGRICWGNNPLPPATAAAMPAVWELFLQAPFNDHIVAGRTQTADVRALLHGLHQQAAPTFPLAELRRLPGSPTLQQQLQRTLLL